MAPISRAEPGAERKRTRLKAPRYRNTSPHIAVDHHDDHAYNCRQGGQSDGKTCAGPGAPQHHGAQDQADDQGCPHAQKKLSRGDHCGQFRIKNPAKESIKHAIAEKYNRPHRKTNALLAGLVHCPHCGRRLSVISESDR